MKTKISYIRVDNEVKIVTSANGVKGERVATIVLEEPIGNTSAITLSPKQLNNLCGLLQIQQSKAGWKQLASLVGTGGRAAIDYTTTDHKAGTEYTSKDGVVGTYTKDWTQIQVNSIILSEKVTNIFIAETAKRVVNSWDEISWDAEPTSEPATATEQ